MEDDQPVIICNNNDDDYRVVCTTWRLLPSAPSGKHTEINPQDIFSTDNLNLLQRRHTYILKKELGVDTKTLSWKNSPPTLDIEDVESAKQALRSYKKTVRREEASENVLKAGMSINRVWRGHIHCGICASLIQGNADAKGWGFVSEISNLIYAGETEYQSIFPHTKAGQLVFKSCKGPVLSQSTVFKTSIVSKEALKIVTALSEGIPHTQPPPDDRAPQSFSHLFLQFHGTGPILDIESVRKKYADVFSLPSVVVPFRLHSRGKHMNVNDSFTVISGIGRVCVFRHRGERRWRDRGVDSNGIHVLRTPG